jgi:hypothetical protein
MDEFDRIFRRIWPFGVLLIIIYLLFWCSTPTRAHEDVAWRHATYQDLINATDQRSCPMNVVLIKKENGWFGVFYSHNQAHITRRPMSTGESCEPFVLPEPQPFDKFIESTK